jgi:hypothetical protein
VDEPVQGNEHEQRSRRIRVTTTAIVLASLFVVFLAVTVLMVVLHHSAPTGKATTATVTSSDSARLVAATNVADEATSTTRSELHQLKGIPTPDTVARLINPYVTALQRYAIVLSGTDVPAHARSSAAEALAQVGDDVQDLSPINGLRAVRLGTYLETFGRNAAQFQKALGTLEHDLRSPAT